MENMVKKFIIVGAGINGLVAANYLARAGHTVTIIERKGHAGGACTAASCEIDGVEYEYPQGASVLGMMQDFVFEETGLSKRVRIHEPSHPLMIYSADGSLPRFQWDDPLKFEREARERWSDTGRSKEFLADMEKVVTFLRRGYRDAAVPSVQSAEASLGEELTARWITGSARDLLDHYFTSDALKLIFAISTVESGPVSFNAPYSAFSIPLMSSGSVFDGSWGYVEGGIWQIPLALDAINAELGIERIFNAQVMNVDHENMVLNYTTDESEKQLQADYILFATDPLTAAKIAGESTIENKIHSQATLGTGGKLVMLFRNPVEWKDETGMPEFAMSMRDIVPVASMEEFEERAKKVVVGESDFIPGYIEIYPEGVADRAIGAGRSYDIVSVYLSILGNRKTGAELPEVKKQITDLVLSKILNPEDLIGTIL
jgi:phytoene dehydrogenase-like protein